MKDSPMIAILAALKAKKKPEMEMEDSEESTSGCEVAAEEILAAIEAKDAVALSEALMSFIEMCD